MIIHINKFLNNTITDEELDELRCWLQEKKHRTEFETYLRDQSDVYTAMQEIDFKQAYTNISKNIYKSKKTLRKFYTQWVKYAAVFIGIIGVVYGLYTLSVFSNDAEYPIDLTPQITLELDDGTLKNLNETTPGIITDANGKKIVNYKHNTLLYADKNIVSKDVLTYNKLTVPYGKKLKLVLSDGSKIFLNSGSKLKYPTKFIEDMPRDVFLEGEAYFNVKKDVERPFTVFTGKMNTRVLGTKFNVSNYKNENNTSTVLVEGSVGVYDASTEYSDKNYTPIVPGQRAVFKKNAVSVDNVNTRKYIAWTEGKLCFVNDRFDLIFKELERHFNVTINNIYTLLNTELLTGTFETETLEQILITFKAYKTFEYTMEGNIITITQPKQ